MGAWSLAHLGPRRLLLLLRLRLALIIALVSTASFSWAQSVALSGVSGTRALVVVDGTAPKFLSAGQAYQGVTLLGVAGDTATVDVGGRQHTLRVGEAPVSIGSSASAGGTGERVVLTADGRGHFVAGGQINGQSVRFLIDTGATNIILGEADARRINLPFDKGQKVGVSTANGQAVGHMLRLQSVRLGDVQVYDVAAIVLPQTMPYVLLGNSFLTRFQMLRQNDQLTLEKRF
ncbi:MAG: TIGR02281 family clan AA aspartic protease [Hydrogenophaga sp.]